MESCTENLLANSSFQQHLHVTVVDAKLTK